MAYSGLIEFIKHLEKCDELLKIKTFVDPILEIAEITDRISKRGGKALFFENTGTDFPVLINAFGSGRRMAMAISRETIEDAGADIEKIFHNLSGSKGTIFEKMSSLPSLIRFAGFFPARIRRKGLCQQIVHKSPDLGILPVLKCWPHDGGRFITLPMVHTCHPVTGKSNVGMYRMQILDRNTTAMHWQRHKTGASHFEAWKKSGRLMPVSVALGGDPVYTYSATAPLPENVDEYILAGFLRRKKVRLVRCLTNSIFVPYDADIVIEGYVDPSEDMVWEGPFGDHTGFYSLADWYPRFHVTCITHKRNAVYPATIVGIPPQEDAWLAKATEKIFLSPVKLTIQPEIEDFHMPEAGIAHNLVIVKIKKTYPGQGMKVISSLFGAGQMMFTKYLVVTSGDINIRNYEELLVHVFRNIDIGKDIMFIRGPLDVLDHASDSCSFGGKAGIDATLKMDEETGGIEISFPANIPEIADDEITFLNTDLIIRNNISLLKRGIPILIISVDRSGDPDVLEKIKEIFAGNDPGAVFRLIVAVDHSIDPHDLFITAWQVLGNSDPLRDHSFISPFSVLIDGTIKAFRKGGFPRKWPNVVCSDNETIAAVDKKWESLGIGTLIQSPSLKSLGICQPGKDEILISAI